MKNLIVLSAVTLLAFGGFAQTKEGVEKCKEAKEKETGFIERHIISKEVREKVYERECFTEGAREAREAKEAKEHEGGGK